MVCLPRCSASLLLLTVLLAGLLDSASAIVYNYTTFFSPPVGCSITVGTDGSIYVGMCGQQTILKLTSSFTAVSSYNSQVALTLQPYTNNSNNILQFDQLSISSTGVLWFNDIYNLRILGVDSSTGTSVSTISLASVGGALAIGVTSASPNVWAATPGASTGTATVQQYSPTGTLLTSFSGVTDPVNLASYFVMGVQPDPTLTYVYIGGCVLVNQGSILYQPGQGFDYETAPGNFYPCDVRKVLISSLTVQLPILSVNKATRAWLGTNTSFFQQIAVAPSGSTVLPPAAVIAADTFNGVLFVFNSSTNSSNTTQTGNFSGLSVSPAFTLSGSILSLEGGGTRIAQYNPAGTPMVVYNISTVTFDNPYYIGLGPGGSPVYVASENGGAVAIMNSQASITGYIGSGVLIGPNAITTDASGNVYIIDSATNILYKFSSSGTLLLNFTAPTLNPYIGGSVCVDPNNGNVRIRARLTQTITAAVAHTLPLSAVCYQVVVPADNSSSSASPGQGYVLVWSANGTLLNVFGQSISYPFGCSITSSSLIVVTSANIPGAIVFINPTTGSVSSVGESVIGSLSETLGMAIAPDGRIFVAALTLGIYVFNSAGVYQGIVSSPSEDIYSYSMAYTTASNGLLYVVDLFNNRIVTFPVGYGSAVSSTGAGPTSGSSRTGTGLAPTAVIATASVILALLILVY